jgi:3',5'-cyclic AMP phosphodiesterase CpdA
VAFVSDSQEPLWIEKLRLKANRNDEAWEAIARDMLDARPRAIVHLGDMVALGFWDAGWTAVDSFLVRTQRVRIPVYPAIGNHELMLFPRLGMERARERFPWIDTTWYCLRFGPLAVVILNSNFFRLDDDHATRQVRWLERVLADLDADSAIRLTAVACHHSPFTNSTIVDPSAEVRRIVLPFFFHSSKARLFLSGHAHASEHFRQSDRDFVVLGGGGGLTQPLLQGAERRYDDLFTHPDSTSGFHYLRCTIRRDRLVLTVRALNADFTSFSETDTVEVFFAQQ